MTKKSGSGPGTKYRLSTDSFPWGLGLYMRPHTCFLCLDWLATERLVSLTARGFQFFLHFTFYLS